MSQNVCPEDLFLRLRCPGILVSKLDLKDVPSQGKDVSRIAREIYTAVQMGLFSSSCLNLSRDSSARWSLNNDIILKDRRL